ncbi:hypothetical protein L6R52_12635 [Myxococcota bacterium]|nr:hypothetical protein [Myxococcota bacterium]
MCKRSDLRGRDRTFPSLVTLVAVLGGAACTETNLPVQPSTCPSGTVRAGAKCLPPPGVDAGDELPPRPDATPLPDASDDAGVTGDGGGGATLPFFIDDYYVMSGYMGGGEVTAEDCPPGAGSRGPCRKLTWTPNGAPWVGFYFQYPANNWTGPGLAIAPGARSVRFRVWGAVGGESVNFAVGIRDADGFQLETGYSRLGTSPERREISLDGVSYTTVTGAFAWFLDNPTGAASVTIYLDDIEWTNEGGALPDAGVVPDAGVAPDAGPGADAGGATALPFWLDDYYVMSGYMGAGNVETTPCPANPGSSASPCRRITWTPAGAEWAGFYFQYPADNWTMPGLQIVPGASRVTFWVWGVTGTESLNFAAGINAVDGFQVETGYSVVSTARTQHTIDLSGVSYPNGVAGGFAWFVNNPGGASTVSFFLDDIRWE